jgi:hypothetical protein
LGVREENGLRERQSDDRGPVEGGGGALSLSPVLLLLISIVHRVEFGVVNLLSKMKNVPLVIIIHFPGLITGIMVVNSVAYVYRTMPETMQGK